MTVHPNPNLPGGDRATISPTPEGDPAAGASPAHGRVAALNPRSVGAWVYAVIHLVAAPLFVGLVLAASHGFWVGLAGLLVIEAIAVPVVRDRYRPCPCQQVEAQH